MTLLAEYIVLGRITTLNIYHSETFRSPNLLFITRHCSSGGAAEEELRLVAPAHFHSAAVARFACRHVETYSVTFIICNYGTGIAMQVGMPMVSVMCSSAKFGCFGSRRIAKDSILFRHHSQCSFLYMVCACEGRGELTFVCKVWRHLHLKEENRSRGNVPTLYLKNNCGRFS